MVEQKYKLDVIPGGLPINVYVSQYDTGRKITFTLYNRDTELITESGSTATVQGVKPDGKAFDYPATINGSQVSFITTEQMTAVSGSVECNIVITDKDGKKIGSSNFVIKVKKSVTDENTVVSDSDIPLLQQAIDASVYVKNTADELKLKTQCYQLIKVVSNTTTFTFKSNFTSYKVGSRQTVFIFGADNSAPICGLLIINAGDGVCVWTGLGNAVLTANMSETGTVTVTLPTKAYDNFTLISADRLSK